MQDPATSALALPRRALSKIPRQQRSIDLVHAALDATRRILQREGMVAFTTNRVAETAGISIGSLYQYFRNKDALLLGLVERGVVETQEAARKAMAAGDPSSFEEGLELQLRAFIELLEPRRKSLRELLVATPLLSETGFMATVEGVVVDLLAQLELQFGHPPAPAATRYVTASAMAFTFLRWLTESPPQVTQDQFIATIVRLVVGLQVPTQHPLNSNPLGTHRAS